MPLIVVCEGCKARFDVSAFAAGARLKCARCKAVVTVPAAPAAAPTLKLPAAPPAAAKPAPPRTAPASELPRSTGGPPPVPPEETPVDPEAAASDPTLPTVKMKTPPRMTRERPRPRRRLGAEPESATGGGGKRGGRLPLFIGGGAVLLLALGIGGWYGFSGSTPAAPPAPALSPERQAYEELLRSAASQDPQAQLSLALAAEKAFGEEKMLEHLRQCLELHPANGRALAKARLVYAGKARSAKSDPAERLALARFCDGLHLDHEKRREAARVLSVDPKNAEAIALLGLTEIDGRHEPAVVAGAIRKVEADRASEQARLDALPVRDREVARAVKKLQAEFGPVFEFKDEKPFLVCVMKDASYSIPNKMGYITEQLKAMYTEFFRRYGEKFDLRGMDEEVIIVWVFNNPENYRTYAHVGPNVGGHYEPQHRRLMLYHGTYDPYETVFHEGTHQLVHFATLIHGEAFSNSFWFQEGIACFFEAVKHGADGKWVVATLNRERLMGIQQMIKMKREAPLEKLVKLRYGMVNLNAPGDEKNLDPGEWYAQSWSLIYFLNTGADEKYKDKFEEYFKAEITGKGSYETFVKIVGDPKALEPEWREYIKGLKAD